MSKSQQFKPIKSYEEYMVDFKNACKELGRSITPSELEKHKFGLPSAIWLVKNSNTDIKTLNDLLESLGYKPIKKRNKPNRKYTYEIAFEEFRKRGFILLPQKYISCAAQMNYICPSHPNIIQHKSLNALIFDTRDDGSERRCIYCHLENNHGSDSKHWNGGSSSLHPYLREFINEWKKDSMANSDYKCVITGDKFDAIHHVYSFNKILKEILRECKLPIYKEISMYTEEELNLLKETNINVHNKYPLGVCLRKDIHKLYHRLYGNNNTLEQFEEFRIRYNIGEFKDIIKTQQTANSKIIF